jgi:hypothetical protein
MSLRKKKKNPHKKYKRRKKNLNAETDGKDGMSIVMFLYVSDEVMRIYFVFPYLRANFFRVGQKDVPFGGGTIRHTERSKKVTERQMLKIGKKKYSICFSTRSYDDGVYKRRA